MLIGSVRVEQGKSIIDKIGRHRTCRPNRFVMYQCDYCQEIFEITWSKHQKSQKYNKRSFCSTKCARHRICSQSPVWKGGRRKTKDGYIMRTVPPNYPGSCPVNKRKNWRILEHRMVMQDLLGRVLLKTETVHHKNGVRDDNRPENLELRAGQHGRGATSYTEDVNKLLLEISTLKRSVQTEISNSQYMNQIDV